MNIISFLTSPYILAINTITTVILAFLTLRDKYLTFPHFKINDFETIFLTEGILLVKFEILNTSKVPFSFKSINLITSNGSYSPKILNSAEYCLDYGDITTAVKRVKNISDYIEFITFDIEPFTINYGEFKKVAFLFPTFNKDLLSKKPRLLLKSGLKEKEIKVDCPKVI